MQANNRRQGADVAPNIKAQLAQFEARREALNDQLVSLTVRRDLLTQQMRNADEAGKAQLEAQLKDVGNRTASVNAELNKVDDAVNKLLQGSDVTTPALTPAPPMPALPALPGRQGITIIPPGRDRSRPASGNMAFDAFGFALVIFLMWRWLRRPHGAVKLGSEDVNRLEQMQRAIDVMAVEVERISESQRYVAKLLNEGRELGAGAAQSVVVARDAQRVGTDRG